ncbi:MAG: hypothetical protein AB8G26_13870, partial [Ilumatobacter sp.]
MTDIVETPSPVEVDPDVQHARELRVDRDLAALRERAASLPWWRRPRELRPQLAWTLVATALASVLLVGGLNYVAASDLLDDGTQDQLVGIGEARARTIENGVDRLIGQVSALSGDLGVVTALDELANEFDNLDAEPISADQMAALERHYQAEVVDLYDRLDLEDVTVAEFLPDNPSAQYLQYHYTVSPTLEGVDPASIADAGDGSDYSAIHALHHASLEAMLTGGLGGGDALLVTLAGDVVYSVDKRIDFGTNLIDGPHADSNLAVVLRERLTRVRAGNAVIADVELYLPAQGRPVLFAAATVKNDTEAIGVLVSEIPVEALSQVTTTGQQWELYGLQSGESYVVGADLRLRSESRRWIEDPEGYLGKVNDERLELLISELGTPIGLQEVDTKPVRTALDGDEFTGTANNYLGTKNFSYAEPIAVPGVEWVVVVDVPIRDARSPLFDYGRRLGVVLLIILPTAALIGLWLARRLTRPIGPVVATATAIVQ